MSTVQKNNTDKQPTQRRRRSAAPQESLSSGAQGQDPLQKDSPTELQVAGPPARICLWQSEHEYPMLQIMITNNSRYQTSRMMLDDVEEALEKIEIWIRKKLNDSIKG